MDQEKHIVHSQAEDCVFGPGTTPPDRRARLPPTPPATGERHAATQNEGSRRVREYKRKAEEGDVPPFAEFDLETQHYNSKSIERLVRRHDYDARRAKLVVRMPSTIHEYFSTRVIKVLDDQLRHIGETEGTDGEFALGITSVGSARIFLEGDEADSKTVRRQPDGQFQHKNAIFPGVVLEVSWSQDGKNLRWLAQDYILGSRGEIKAVIGFDINPPGKESTVSLWRAKFTWLEDEKTYSLEADPKLSQKPFRQVDGSSANQDEFLVIPLSDFSSEEVSKVHDSILLSVAFGRLSGFLADAEQLQRRRESARTEEPRRPLKRIRLPSSSPEELRSEDEAKFADEEKGAANKTEALDGDFQLEHE